MTRLLAVLFWGVVAWLVIRAFRRRRAVPPNAARVDASSEVSGAEPVPPQTMVRCAHCGVHVPEADALADADMSFCSAEHRRLGVKKHD